MNFWIPGDPKSQPRPRAQGIKNGSKQFTHIYTPDKQTKHWRAAIRASVASSEMQAFDNAAIFITLWFNFKRPKSHFRTGKFCHLLKSNAPELHKKKPDVDNLAKLILDELQRALLFNDDSQVVKLTTLKTWSAQPGCLVVIDAVPGLNALFRINANHIYNPRGLFGYCVDSRGLEI